tara:strand:+ start:967 stop:2436 length:1470 start_codon:yes stop_codon:yes gene_type:complete
MAIVPTVYSSDFCIPTNFNVGDQIKIIWSISNNIPQASGATAYIVDLQEMHPYEDNPEIEFTPWSNVNAHIGGLNTNDGQAHTNAIINQAEHVISAAKLSDDLVRTVSGSTYDDWYLPTLGDVSKLYQLRTILDPVIANEGGSILTKSHTTYNLKAYWASSESVNPTSPNPVFSVSFNPSSGGGASFGRAKTMKFRSRSIRKQVLSASEQSSLSVGSVFGGGVIFRIVEENTTTVTPKVDLTVKISNTTIGTYTNLGNQVGNFIEHTITSNDGSAPNICFLFSNSNTGEYPWITNVEIYKVERETITEIQAGTKTTLAWSDDSKRWVSRYSYIPEYMSTHKTGIVSFVNGDLYIHDDSVNKNYFYGGFFPTMVTYVDNISPSQPKVFVNHAVEGSNKPNYTTLETEDNWAMFSDLVNDDYVRREGTYYSEMFGDTNDPNVGVNASFGDKLRRGTKLRGQYIKVGMIFNDNDLEVKHSNVGFITSKGHTT